ncbi:hypothetical protein [Scytonema sp. HK-05]|uniref:hypothetical protein n=1 Tax=Scytonema sp. HK-05 TaxID=1137095 RepID=UPI0009657E2A|nr:hypothetical protein [Scytonema sp. HK-05]OKH56558.1 hypothetical protein NIES2130_24715 [Scytonema sp. HK-05]
MFLLILPAHLSGTYLSNLLGFYKCKISPNPSNPLLLERWKIIGEEFTIPDIYVSLKAQLIDSNGKVNKQAVSVDLES